MRAMLSMIALLCLFAARPGAALAADSPLDGIDVMTATVFEQGQSSFSGIGIRARIKSERLAPSADVLPWIEYWRNATRIDAFDLRATRRDATLGCDLRWTFAGESMKPYIGGGVGLHFFSAEVDAPGSGFDNANESVTRGAFALMAGLKLGEPSRFSQFAEVRFHAIPRASQVKIHLGLSWNMGASAGQ